MTESGFEQLKAEILQKLHEHLDHRLVYHSAEHTRDVLFHAERIALSEKITDNRLLLLIRIAALFHDTGFLYTYRNHEERSCAIMHNMLANGVLAENEKNLIAGMIMATKIPQSPTTLAQQVLCDADLDYLGRHDFETISNRLKQELKSFDIIGSDEEWDHIQVSFFEQHKYFTATSSNTRHPLKMAHLENLKRRISIQNL